MKQTVLLEKYPVYELELDKNETTYQSAEEVIEALKTMIQAHPLVSYIGDFDHYTHTRNLAAGEIAPGIRDARLVVFCFGVKLPNPHVLAVRPRSIGVADMGDRFVINFLEPPMPVATEAMEGWVKSLRNRSQG
jgi:hypothetical protein